MSFSSGPSQGKLIEFKSRFLSSLATQLSNYYISGLEVLHRTHKNCSDELVLYLHDNEEDSCVSLHISFERRQNGDIGPILKLMFCPDKGSLRGAQLGHELKNINDPILSWAVGYSIFGFTYWTVEYEDSHRYIDPKNKPVEVVVPFKKHVLGFSLVESNLEVVERRLDHFTVSVFSITEYSSECIEEVDSVNMAISCEYA